MAGFSKDEIVELSQSIGARLEVRKKDARDRTLRRLAQVIAALPEDQKERVLSELSVKPDRQTEGWVGVIRKGK